MSTSDATVDLINLGSYLDVPCRRSSSPLVAADKAHIPHIARRVHEDQVCRYRPRQDQQLFQINGMTANVDVKQATSKPHRSHKLQIVFRPTSEHGSAIFSLRRADHVVRCMHVAFETGLGIVNWEAWVGIKA